MWAGDEAGRALGVTVEARTFPEGTKTARDAADAIGVEVGQILFVLVLVAAYRALKPVFVRLLAVDHGKPAWAHLTVPASYVVGSIASYWMIDRIAGFWA